MNKCKKMLKPLLLILGILFVCLAFAGCGESEEWNHSAGNWKETDGVFFGLICKDDAPEGEIKADKVDADLAIRLDREYYYIIDFVLQAAENNSGWEKLTVSININAENVLASDLQETSSSDYTNILHGDEREIAVTYTVPDYAETQIKKRIVLDLKPKEYGEAEAKIDFTSGVELAGLPETVSYNLGVRYTQNLKYEENAQGGYTVYKGTATDENVIIPYRINGKYVTEIGDKAFYGYKNMKTIIIPDSVTGIDSWSFYNCSSLTNITLSYGLTSIGEYAFDRCSSLTSIIIPNSVINISGGTFFYCSSLTSITIPDSVTSIGDHAFRECSSLTSIIIPDGVTSVGEYAFRECSSLTSLTIPDCVKYIGDCALWGCSSLTSITIPESIINIGEYTFVQCNSLADIIFKGTKDQWGAISKGFRWNYNAGNYTVHCTDGNLSKE